MKNCAPFPCILSSKFGVFSFIQSIHIPSSGGSATPATAKHRPGSMFRIVPPISEWMINIGYVKPTGWRKAKFFALFEYYCPFPRCSFRPKLSQCCQTRTGRAFKRFISSWENERFWPSFFILWWGEEDMKRYTFLIGILVDAGWWRSGSTNGVRFQEGGRREWW